MAKRPVAEEETPGALGVDADVVGVDEGAVAALDEADLEGGVGGAPRRVVAGVSLGFAGR